MALDKNIKLSLNSNGAQQIDARTFQIGLWKVRVHWTADPEKRTGAGREEILRIAAKYGASNVRIFGSVARGEADEQSDIDLLVDLEPKRSLLDLAGLLVDLEELLGCKVDVVPEDSLRKHIKDRVLKEAVAL